MSIGINGEFSKQNSQKGTPDTAAHSPAAGLEGRTNDGQWPEPNLRPKPKSHFTFFSSFSKGRGPASAQSCHITRPSALNNLHLVKILFHF